MNDDSALRVLVIDTSPEWGNHVFDALVPVGCEVDWAGDVDTAMEYLEDARHDLAIVEETLEDLRGRDVIAALRARRPALRAIITVDEFASHHERLTESAGAVVVPKSLDVRALRALVSACFAPALH